MEKRVAAATMIMFTASGRPKNARPAAIGPGSAAYMLRIICGTPRLSISSRAAV
ncbi:hypothetical protein Q088_00681 [Pseudomonas aeruginosa C41]|nr:hypothetical protein Q088_00681 [Pseudomonas aeruginosa C41]